MDILYLLLGWALGVLSPAISRHIDRKRRGGELEDVICRELRQIRHMMAPIAHDLGTRCNILDDAFLANIRPAFEDPEVPEDDPRAKAVLKEILALPVAQQNGIGQAKRKPGSSPRLVTYSPSTFSASSGRFVRTLISTTRRRPSAWNSSRCPSR